jgi:hypothetical protein
MNFYWTKRGTAGAAPPQHGPAWALGGANHAWIAVAQIQRGHLRGNIGDRHPRDLAWRQDPAPGEYQYPANWAQEG